MYCNVTDYSNNPTWGNTCPKAPPDQRLSIASASILVIDDHREHLRVLGKLLKEQGYTVRLAPGGRLGLQSATTEPPDLLLLDIAMPEMDGYAVCQQLKADARTSEIPIIFLSALDDAADKVRAFAVGGADYVTKPFQAEEVLTRIGHQLTIQRTRQALRRSEAELQQANAELEDRVAKRTAALHESRSLLQSILDHMPAAVYVKDQAGRYMVANRYLVDLLDRPAEEIIGKSEFDIFTHDIAVAWQETDQQVLRNRAPITYEEQVALKEAMTTYLTTKFPIFDGQGEIVATGGISLDIQERKEAEEQLRASEARLRLLLQSMPVLVDAFDADENILVWNGECERITGYTAAEMVGNAHALELLYPDPAYREQMLTHMVCRDFTFHGMEWDVTCKDGSIRTIAWSNISKQLPIPGWAQWAIGVDVTERKHAEEAYRALVNQSLQGLVIFQDHRIVFANAAMSAINGYSLEEMRDWTSEHFARLIYPDDQAMVWSYQRDRIAGRPVPPRYEYRIIRKDGSVRWLEAYATVISYRGRPANQGTYLDITERKQAEEQLQRYAAELEQRAAEARQFAYIVSHDMRAPLVNLKGFAGELQASMELVNTVLQDALPYLESEQQRRLMVALHADAPEALSFISSAISQMDRLVTALLKLARLGQRELHMELVDMQQLVAGILRTLAHQIAEQHIHISLGVLPAVTADQTAMVQIIGNILSNAVRYLDPARPGEISVSGELIGSEALLHVRDNGRGIAPEDMDKVFAPFRRAGKPDRPGEGMGLAYVQMLVRRHGGTIVCTSTQGVGTIFTIRLPVIPPAE